MPIHFEHYRGNEKFVKRIYDLIDLMERRRRIVVTPFFAPDECNICDAILGHQIPYRKSGGYQGAERCRYALLPYEDELADLKITILKATYSPQFGKLAHPDVLGAILNLGIEREKIGDLIVKDNELIIFVDEEIENYIVCNLTRIKRSNVHFKRYEGEVTYEPKIRYEHKIVSSLRLDVLVSSFANISRKKAQELIRAGLVKVNHVILEETSYLCNNNSAISIRGHGRFYFKEIVKTTKKDHLVILAGKYQ